mgnify:CR=1 FL=1
MAEHGTRRALALAESGDSKGTKDEDADVIEATLNSTRPRDALDGLGQGLIA